MTIYDHVIVMAGDRVGVAELKARLSHYLRRVRRGHPVTVLDRDTPIARLVPLEPSGPLTVRRPMGRVARLQDVPLPGPLSASLPPGCDLLDLLRQERQPDR
ncbi:MAG: type II toxin-antitoxin system Phd/YefM family antitoxin [Gemmatimonadota bacterium]